MKGWHKNAINFQIPQSIQMLRKENTCEFLLEKSCFFHGFLKKLSRFERNSARSFAGTCRKWRLFSAIRCFWIAYFTCFAFVQPLKAVGCLNFHGDFSSVPAGEACAGQFCAIKLRETAGKANQKTPKSAFAQENIGLADAFGGQRT